MKALITLVLIIITINPVLSQRKRDIKFIEYISESKSSSSSLRIKLYEDNVFELYDVNHFETLYSQGVWSRINDTFVFNSNLQKDNLPIIIQSRNLPFLDRIFIDYVRDKNFEILIEPIVYINGDVTHGFPPSEDSSNTFPLGKIDSFRIESNGYVSQWYNVNKNDNFFSVAINTNENLYKYIVLKNEKYFLSNNKICKYNNKICLVLKK